MSKVAVRIDDDLNDEVNAVARADDIPASEVVRAAPLQPLIGLSPFLSSLFLMLVEQVSVLK